LQAVNSDGALRWEFDLDESMATLPITGPDGACYSCTVSGQLHAISAGGRWKWKLDENISVSSADLGPEGTIYLISGDTLYAVED